MWELSDLDRPGDRALSCRTLITAKEVLGFRNTCPDQRPGKQAPGASGKGLHFPAALKGPDPSPLKELKAMKDWVSYPVFVREDNHDHHEKATPLALITCLWIVGHSPDTELVISGPSTALVTRARTRGGRSRPSRGGSGSPHRASLVPSASQRPADPTTALKARGDTAPRQRSEAQGMHEGQ